MQDTLLNTFIIMGCLMVGTAFLSLGVTRLLLFLLPKWGIIDKPDFQRHIHTLSVPRGGGIGFSLTFIAIALLYGGFSSTVPPHHFKQICQLLLPLAILIPTGILDDRFSLRPRYKLLLQIITASLAWYLGFNIKVAFALHFSPIASYLLTVLWITAFINAFNMIDGVDGLATGVGFISSICMLIVAFSNKQFVFGTLLGVFAASLLGFLYFNWNPARIFMGDTGSMFIGYFLAVSGLVLNARVSMVASIGVPLLACGIPALDIILAVWRRLVGGQTSTPSTANDKETAPSTLNNFLRLFARLGTADQSHLHHRLLRYFNNNQKKTVSSIYMLAVVMGGIGIACGFLPSKRLALALFLVLGTFSFIINKLAAIELWNSTEAIYHNFQSARTGIILTFVINPLWDLFTLCIAYFIANDFTWAVFNINLRHICIILAFLFISRSYRVFWNFAVSDDYFRISCTLLFGFFASAVANLLFDTFYYHQSFTMTWDALRLHAFAGTLSAVFILLERAFLHYFRNSQVKRANRSNVMHTQQFHTLLVGITPLTRFYRNCLLANVDNACKEELVGVASLDKHFVHSYCYGMKVLGTIDKIEEIATEHHINRIVLTDELTQEDGARLQEYCRTNKIQLQIFNTSSTELN